MALGLYAPAKGIPLLTSGRNLSGFEEAHPPKFILDGNMDTYWRPDSFTNADNTLYIKLGSSDGLFTPTRISAIALWIHNYNEDFTSKAFVVSQSTDDNTYSSDPIRNIEDYRAPFSPLLVYPLNTPVDNNIFRRITFINFGINVPVGIKPEISAWWLLEDYALPHSHQPDTVKNVSIFHNRSTITRSGIPFNSHAGIGIQRTLERHFIMPHVTGHNLDDMYKAIQGSLRPVFAQFDHNSTEYRAAHLIRPLIDTQSGHEQHDITLHLRELGHKRIPYKDRSLFPLTDTVGLWRFKGNGIDESGAANHFTVGGSYDASNFGRGFVDHEAISAVNLQLGGDSAQFNIIPADADDFSFDNGDFTIEMWQLMRSTVVGSDRFTLIKPGAWSMVNDGSFQIGMNLNDGINNGFWSNATPTADNKWHLHTAVVNRTANTLDFYVDGTFVKTQNISVITGTLTVTAGLYHQGLVQAGVIDTDEICITKRALTTAEILDRYNGRTTYGDWGM